MTGAVEFAHRWVPPRDPALPTLLLLHGTGGDENDLLPLGERLLAGAGLLSPRGRVLERGMPRFFRRLAEGVFDQDDMRRRTDELADFVTDSAARYGFDPGRVVAVGFSNGANIATSVLLRRPGTLGGAVLLRAMVPFEPDPLPRLADAPVLLSEGREDPIVSEEEAGRLASLLDRAGARVTLRWQDAGHGLVPADVGDAARWLLESSGFVL
jgi:phospholipase/carboxylesterase/glyoxalase family protein